MDTADPPGALTPLGHSPHKLVHQGHPVLQCTALGLGRCLPSMGCSSTEPGASGRGREGLIPLGSGQHGPPLALEPSGHSALS